jgi:nitrate reductase cytochrome c-type subunit
VITQRPSLRMSDVFGRARRFVVCVGVFCVILGGGIPLSGGADAPPPGSAKRLPRMYDGAPPQIPHSVVGLEGLCLGCHLEGAQGAPIVPHPDRPNCRQCHVTQDPTIKPLVKNTFSGKPVPPPR